MKRFAIAAILTVSGMFGFAHRADAQMHHAHASDIRYYLPPNSAPVYVPQWRTGPSMSASPTAGTPILVNPSFYPNGVLISRYPSPNIYAAPQYVVRPAPLGYPYRW
jgi:hypothetical protein